MHGHHAQPYLPDSATTEYRLLADRAVTNWCPLLVATPAQALYVDNFRRSGEKAIDAKVSREWGHWQESRLDARQAGVYEAALAYGQSYVLTEKNAAGKVISRGLSPRLTVTLYEDAAFDLDPVAAVYVKRWPTDKRRGLAYVWDDQDKYEIEFDNGELNARIVDFNLHGATQVPVTRFTAHLDLEGRAWGVIEPIIPLQNRINQTVFDLLVGQTYNSFAVRFVSGMAPPFKTVLNTDTGEYEPLLGEDGNPVPDRQYLNAARWFYAEDADAKFGSLPGGDLDGFIQSAELSIRHLSSLTQTPPHFLLGQIANVSAEALDAAEMSLSRKVESFKSSFGESWERVFRISMEIIGDVAAAEDFLGEVVWRDLGVSSLAQTADGLGKFAESLDIPKRGLWNRVPNVTRQELQEWADLREEEDRELRLYEAALSAQKGGTATPGQERVPGATRFAASAQGAVNGVPAAA